MSSIRTEPLGSCHANPHIQWRRALVDLTDRPVIRSAQAGCSRRVPWRRGRRDGDQLHPLHQPRRLRRRPYQCGDRLVRGYSATVVTDRGEPIEAIAERLYTRHNRDDRPDGELCPSMSVGDVVVIGEVTLSVGACGWCRVHPDQAVVISDRSWRTVTGEHQLAVPHGIAHDIVTN